MKYLYSVNRLRDGSIYTNRVMLCKISSHEISDSAQVGYTIEDNGSNDYRWLYVGTIESDVSNLDTLTIIDNIDDQALLNLGVDVTHLPSMQSRAIYHMIFRDLAA